MARVSKSEMTRKNPAEWVRGTKAAREARANVAIQIQDLILDADLSGSSHFVARRVRQYSEAVKAGDPSAQRAALMELSVAAATTAASMDLQPGLMAA
jgi:hypothetical protein